MRSAHSNRICNYFHWIVKSVYRNFKYRIAILINRLIFFITDQHIIVVRTAPLYRCSYLTIFDSKFRRWCYRCFAWATFHLYFCGIVAIFQLQILSSYFFCILCCFNWSIWFFFRICNFYFMVIPFIFCSDQGNVKFFINRRYRNVKSVNFICHSVTVGNRICRWLKNLCTVFLSIFCRSNKEIYDFFGIQTYMNGHFAIFDSQFTFSVVCFIYMEHGAVGIKLCCVDTIFQDITFCSIVCFSTFWWFVCFCLFCSFLLCRFCRNCLRSFCQNRAVTADHKCST